MLLTCVVLCCVALSEMGEVLVIRGDYKRANKILREAATMQRHFLPTNHWETALSERL